MRILALDLATQTGFAVTAPDGSAPILGTFRIATDAIHDDFGRAFLALHKRVGELIEVHQPTLMWFEAPLFITQRRVKTARFLMGLSAIVELIAEERSLPCYEASVSDVRMFVAGSRHGKNGRGPKEIGFDYCAMRGWHPPDDNAADAALLWVYALSTKGVRA